MSFTFTDISGGQAADVNQALKQLTGYGFVEGGRPTEGAGPFDVDIRSATTYIDGEEVTTEAVSVNLEEYTRDLDRPRKAIIYIGADGEFHVAAGDPATPEPRGHVRFGTFQPSPPDFRDRDGVPVVEVWLGANSQHITDEDIRDRRLNSQIEVHGLNGFRLDFEEIIDGSGTTHERLLEAGEVMTTDDVVDIINADDDHATTAPHEYFSGSHDDLTAQAFEDHHPRYEDEEAYNAIEGRVDLAELTASDDATPGTHFAITETGIGGGWIHGADWTPIETTETEEYALDFDGDTDYVETDYVPTQDDFADGGAIELWVKWRGTSSQDAHGSWGEPRLYLNNYHGSLQAGFGDGWQRDRDVSHPIGEWAHYIVTNDGTTTRVYLDGEEVMSFASAFSGSQDTEFTLGMSSDNGRHADALVGEVCIHDSHLDAQAVTDRYNARQYVYEDSIAAPRDTAIEMPETAIRYWTLEHGTGERIGEVPGWAEPPISEAPLLKTGTISHTGGSTTTHTITDISPSQTADFELSTAVGLDTVPSWSGNYGYSVDTTYRWDSTGKNIEADLEVTWDIDPGDGNDLDLRYYVYEMSADVVTSLYSDAKAADAQTGEDLSLDSLQVGEQLTLPVYDAPSDVSSPEIGEMILSTDPDSGEFGEFIYDGSVWTGPYSAGVTSLSGLEVDVAKDWSGLPLEKVGEPTSPASLIRAQDVESHAAHKGAHHAKTRSEDVNHSGMANVAPDQHHARYTDDEAAEAVATIGMSKTIGATTIPDSESARVHAALGEGETLHLLEFDAMTADGLSPDGLSLQFVDMETDEVYYSRSEKRGVGYPDNPLTTIDGPAVLDIRIRNQTGEVVAAGGTVCYYIVED